MLVISQELKAQIERESEKAYPNECCGIIFGKTENGQKLAEKIRNAENSFEAGEQYHRFRITAEEMLAAELYARKSGVDIVGFYHSHPDSKAVPSEYDRSHALPIYSYVIVSAVKGRAADFACYELTENTNYTEFGAEQITINKGV